jgi:replication protein CRI
MYDTIKLWKDCNKDDLESILTNPITSIKIQTGEYFTYGKLENLRVNERSTGISVNGSLAKFFYNNNLERLTRKDTEQAIEKLSDLLNLEMQSARVYRLDVGSNFIMGKPVSEYLSLLGGIRYFKRSEIADRETLMYSNSKRSMVFYDKIKEIKKHHEYIPDLFQNRNVLRYEIKYLKRLAQQFCKDRPLTASDLYNEDFYINVLDRFKDEYFKIHRYKKFKIKDAINMKNSKELVNHLALLGLQSLGGEQIAFDMINDAKQRGELDKMQHKRLKDKVKELSSTEKYTEFNDAIFELDSKVRQAVSYYR